MAASTGEFISTLNNLIETCKDGENGFRESAEGVQDPSLRSVFTEYQQQRSQFATELQQQVAKLGKAPEDSGSVVAAMHRGWINLKSAVTGKDDLAILEEAERGEDSAVKNYKQALLEDIPADLKSLIQTQYSGVQKAHDQIKALRDARRAGRS